MASFIKSVERVTIALDDATNSSSNLTKSQTIADCVLFCSSETDAADIVDGLTFDLKLESGTPDKVTATVDTSRYDHVINVWVVEFDTTLVEVTEYAISRTTTDSSDWATDITASGLGATTEAFIVGPYATCDNSSDNGDNNYLGARFTSTTNVQITAGDPANTSDRTGRFWVVAAQNSEFVVEHVSQVMSSTSPVDVDVNAVTLARAMILYTYETSNARDDAGDVTVAVSFLDFDTIRFDKAGSGFETTCYVQVISFESGTVFTQHGSWGWTSTNEAPTGGDQTLVTAVADDRSMIVATLGAGAHMQTESTEASGDSYRSSRIWMNLKTAVANEWTEIEASRNHDGAAMGGSTVTCPWQVVEWDLVTVGGGTNPKGVFGMPLDGPFRRVVY